jgi:hypothetical protein
VFASRPRTRAPDVNFRCLARHQRGSTERQQCRARASETVRADLAQQQASSSIPYHHKRLASTFNPKVTGSVPAAPGFKSHPRRYPCDSPPSGSARASPPCTSSHERAISSRVANQTPSNPFAYSMNRSSEGERPLVDDRRPRTLRRSDEAAARVYRKHGRPSGRTESRRARESRRSPSPP